MKKGMDDGALEKLMKGRASFYDYLHSLFRGVPDKYFIGKSGSFAVIFSELALERENADIAKGADLLGRYALYEMEKGAGEALTKTAREYADLFLEGSSPIPLTESGYISEEKDTAPRGEKFYGMTGYGAAEDLGLPEGHAAAELFFMKQTCGVSVLFIKDRSYNKIEALLKNQEEFMKGRMLRWMPALCQKLEEAARDRDYPLYEAAACLLRGYLYFDSETIDYLLS